MEIAQNHSLKTLNTFGIDARAAFFARVETVRQLRQVLTSNIARTRPILVLGGGSNVVFTGTFAGLVIHNLIGGIDIIKEDGQQVLVAAGGGMVWHSLVEFALDKNLGGIENLSLIPGSVGAAPIQNIGAYGAELKDVFAYLEAVDLASGRQRLFTREECAFGYRNSIFKNELKDRFMITKVVLRLAKKPQVNISYGAIGEVLTASGITTPTIREVSEAVIAIRQSKLPDPARIGNAGSFFKNPVLDKIDYEGLKLEFSGIPGYPDNGSVKVPAAWLIEQCGWKGKRLGNVGVHDKQPLVLVNYGGGTGTEIVNLAADIKASVATKFGIELEPEPRII